MLEHVNKHAVLPVAFDVVVPDDAVPDDTAGIRQAVRQLATCELQVIMQLVVVEVSGVARPVRGGVTVGMEVCANAKDDKIKAALMHMAQVWLRLAATQPKEVEKDEAD